jgi:methanogenic corrinoid protein MtbC1
LADAAKQEYQHVTVLEPVRTADVPMLQSLMTIAPSPPGTHGDCTRPISVVFMRAGFDAVIVAADMLINHCKKLKYEKAIYVLTDGKSRMNHTGYQDVVAQLQQENIKLTVMCAISLMLQVD